METYGGLLPEKNYPACNSTIPPTARAQDFTTFKDGQNRHDDTRRTRRERELVSDCRSLSNLPLRGIPPMARRSAYPRDLPSDADGFGSRFRTRAKLYRRTGVNRSQTFLRIGRQHHHSKCSKTARGNAAEDMAATRARVPKP